MNANHDRSVIVRRRIQRRSIVVAGGCRLWTGRHKNGHPFFKLDGRDVSIARWLYVASGHLDEPHAVCRSCDNLSCVEAEHIEPYGLRHALSLWADKVSFDHPHGCWLWTGSSDENGYGRVSYKGDLRVVHEFIYEALVGPVPDGLELHHSCFHPECCCPEHLVPVTHRRNLRLRRRIGQGAVRDGLSTVQPP